VLALEIVQAFEDGARERHGRHVILEDPLSGTLTQSRFRIGVALLARYLVERPAQRLLRKWMGA